jgi:hypothetical protein
MPADRSTRYLSVLVGVGRFGGSGRSGRVGRVGSGLVGRVGGRQRAHIIVEQTQKKDPTAEGGSGCRKFRTPHRYGLCWVVVAEASRIGESVVT